MSATKATSLKQDRRQWLKTSAAVLGASLLPGQAMSSEVAEPKTPPLALKGELGEIKSATRFFTRAEHVLIEELSETIIPADSHSGGAKAAKVADYIEQVLHGSVDDSQKSDWRQGLRLVDLMSQHYNGKLFVDSNSEEKIALLTILSDNDHMTDLPEVRFFRDLKHLTIQGYYTSKIGIHDELEYKGNRILVEFVGCDDPVPGPK
jgi:hypothetical protein